MMMDLQQVMVRLSTEIERASILSAGLEATMEHGPDAKVPDIRALQNLDLLNQTLADLARFSAVLPHFLAGGTVDMTDAFNTLILRDIALRLAGEEEAVDTSAAGELAFF